MNEQLVVRNFGPIKEATVDFKRVTVFIGPTGGGKSTLAKLAAVFRDNSIYTSGQKGILASFGFYNSEDFFLKSCFLNWRTPSMDIRLLDGKWQIGSSNNEVFGQMKELSQKLKAVNEELKRLKELKELLESTQETTNQRYISQRMAEIEKVSKESEDFFVRGIAPNKPFYIPAERILLSILGTSWPDLIAEKVNLPATLLDFAKKFLVARSIISNLYLSTFAINYVHQNNDDTLELPNGSIIKLSKAASGIQSVTPLLVLLEHLSRNSEQAQSFIIEEPELNLYPTAQRDLVYWLLDKCTQGENDLTITTHSPYVLSALNLALYANKVATLFPHQKKKVEKLIPEKYWLKAEEFSAYFVAGGGVESIFDAKTGLLSESQLDEVSGDFADIFDQLTDLRVPEKKAPAKAKAPKK